MKIPKANLAISIVTIVLLVVAAEFTLRFLCTYCTWSELNKGEFVSPFTVQNNQWLFTRQPNITRQYATADFNYELKTNSLGIRDIEHAIDKKPDEVRVIGLGDSFTEGQGAPFEQTYLKVLEKKLNIVLKSKKATVIVGGVSGSDPLYNYKLLELKLLDYQPDIVTVTVNSSDMNDVLTRGGEERFLPDGKVEYSAPPENEWIFAWSHLYRMLSMRLFGYDWVGFSPSEHKERTARAISQINACLLNFKTLAEQEQFVFVVLFHPMRRELVLGRYSFDVKSIIRHLQDNNILYIDLMDHLRANIGASKEAADEYYWPRDWHHNAKGYELMAEGILLGLKRLNLIAAME